MGALTVGVVGAGVMGRGLASALLMSGHKVILVDIAEPILSAARQDIARDLRFQKLLSPASIKSAGAPMDSIQLTLQLERIAEADFIVENTTEDWGVKAACHQSIDRICAPDIVIAVNTSAIPITRVASQNQHPERIIGLHLMNPVPMKKTVEVIPGHHTSDDTVARTLSFLSGMGKEGVIVRDSPGFVSNRVLMLAINEAAFLVHEGVATAEQADTIFKRCFGHQMGMLETADLIGLDTILRSIEVLHQAFGDSKYRPCPLLTKMVYAGLLGRKTGEGFYQYQ